MWIAALLDVVEPGLLWRILDLESPLTLVDTRHTLMKSCS
jgi:hypothetical protein